MSTAGSSRSCWHRHSANRLARRRPRIRPARMRRRARGRCRADVTSQMRRRGDQVRRRTARSARSNASAFPGVIAAAGTPSRTASAPISALSAIPYWPSPPEITSRPISLRVAALDAGEQAPQTVFAERGIVGCINWLARNTAAQHNDVVRLRRGAGARRGHARFLQPHQLVGDKRQARQHTGRHRQQRQQTHPARQPAPDDQQQEGKQYADARRREQAGQHGGCDPRWQTGRYCDS